MTRGLGGCGNRLYFCTDLHRSLFCKPNQTAYWCQNFWPGIASHLTRSPSPLLASVQLVGDMKAWSCFGLQSIITNSWGEQWKISSRIWWLIRQNLTKDDNFMYMFIMKPRLLPLEKKFAPFILNIYNFFLKICLIRTKKDARIRGFCQGSLEAAVCWHEGACVFTVNDWCNAGIGYPVPSPLH